jgi:hypothetical protein
VTVTYDRDDRRRRIIIQLAGAFEPPASPDASICAMVRVYASRLAGTVNIAVFRTLEEGRQWLDEPKEYM